MLIISAKITVRKPTSIWFERDMEEPHLYHCDFCQCPLIRYQGFVALQIPGDSVPMKFPMEMYCKNKKCPRVFRFEGFAW